MNFHPHRAPRKRHGARVEVPAQETARPQVRVKGQNARSGGGVRPGFEGGQLPLYRKLPKRGFNNKFAVNYAIVNVEALNKFDDGAVVDMDALLAAKIVRKPLDGLKVLGNGELTKKLTVKATVFSATAKEKIEAAGGKTEEV